MSEIARLIIEQGRQAAEARAAQGAIWGHAVEGLSQIPGQVIAQQQQQQQAKTRLALEAQQGQLNQYHLIDLAEAHQAEAATAHLVQQNTTLDPSTGVSTTDHQAVSRGLLQINPKFANAYMADAEARDQHGAAIQKLHLELQKEQNQYFADRIGTAANAPPDQYDAARAVLNGWVKATAPTNPLLTNLPQDQNGLKLVHQQLLGEAAAHAQVLSNLKEIPKEGSLVDLGQIDPATGKPKVIATGAPQDIHLETKPEMVIQGTTNVPSFNPANGKWTFAGKEVPADQVVRAPPPKDPMAQALQAIALQTAQQNLSDKQRRSSEVKTIADGIAAGNIPPDPEGLQRNGLYGDVLAELQNRGVKFNTLRQEYLAQKRLIQTENSPQGVRLDIAVRSGKAMYDKVDQISEQWNGMGIGPLSRANLALAQQGAKGQDAQKLAVLLTGQIAQLTSDVATVEQNGMTPTNESRAVAEKSLQDWWGDGTIKAMTAQGRANMNIRSLARTETVPIVPGTASAAPAANTAPAPSVPNVFTYDANGKLISAPTK